MTLAFHAPAWHQNWVFILIGIVMRWIGVNEHDTFAFARWIYVISLWRKAMVFSKQCSHGTFLELTYSCGTYRYKALPCNRLSSSNSVFQQVSLRRWLVLIHVMASNSADFSLNYNHYSSVCCYVVLMNPIMFASMTPILSFNYATWDAVWRINYG